MNGLYFAIWRALESIKQRGGEKVNVLYIVDQSHQRSMEEYLSSEDEVIVGNWKKGKLKTCQKLQLILD